MILQNDLFNQAHSIAKKWGSKAFFSFLDQGIFSGTNFAINILLARWLSPTSYGAFAVAFSIYLFLSGFQNALVLEPMAVYGSTRHEGQLEKYIKILTLLQLLITTPFGLIIILMTSFINTDMHSALLGLGIGMPFMLLVWLYRRAFYIVLKPQMSLRISTAYSLFLSIGVIWIFISDRVNPMNIFLLMGIAGAIASLFGWHLIKKQEEKRSKVDRNFNVKSVFLENWKYGYWLIGASIANGICDFLYVPIIGLFLNLADAAAFRSMENFLLPIQQIIAATVLLTLPYISNLVYRKDQTELKRAFFVYVILTVSISSIYSIVITIYRLPIIHLVYQNEFYGSYAWLLPLLFGSLILSMISQSFGIFIRAIEKPEGVWWAKLVSTIFFLTIGILIIYLLNMSGVLISKYAVATIELLIILLLFISYYRNISRSNIEKMNS